MAFKDDAVAQLLPPECADIIVDANRVGVCAATLERWRGGPLTSGRNRDGWTAAPARSNAGLTPGRVRDENGQRSIEVAPSCVPVTTTLAPRRYCAPRRTDSAPWTRSPPILMPPDSGWPASPPGTAASTAATACAQWHRRTAMLARSGIPKAGAPSPAAREPIPRRWGERTMRNRTPIGPVTGNLEPASLAATGQAICIATGTSGELAPQPS